MTIRFLGMACLTLATAAAALAVAAPAGNVPAAPREFRAAWIATVANIDWPTKPGLPVERQQAEMIKLLDAAVDLHLNCVILQVRPSADALYASQIEPWSEYLTGTMGQPPEPFYDPLDFAVAEAHKRGLQLHVWLNPYRVHHADSDAEPAPNHASVADAEIVRTYGKYLWFDPGEPKAVERFLDVVTDIVKRYDIDGVHMDDYFYPYQIVEAGKVVPFPDDESYTRAVADGETLGRDDWRRQNVDHLVEGLYRAVKREKPWVLVGISPFGIWRPGNPEGIAGLDQYATLYADARKWYREGWVDYFTPQLYWPIEGPQSYPKLLAWWQEQNKHDRHLWPGNAAHTVRRSASVPAGKGAWPAEELIEQIALTRKIVKNGPGNVFFSMKCLLDNRDELNDKLKSGPYAEAALIPASTWLGGKPPAKPEVASSKKTDDSLTVNVKLPSGEPPTHWVVRSRRGEQWKVSIRPAEGARLILKSYADKPLPEELAVSAVNRLGEEGPVVRIDVEKLK